MFKLIIIGDSGVGKSCLLLRYVDKRFRPDHDLTIGAEFGSKVLLVDGESVHMQIWDTAGQENFRSITRAYYKGANAAMLVFDVGQRSSFLSLDSWLNEINQNANLSISIVLVGNKSDLNYREITQEEGESFAKERGFKYMETSAKSGSNVDEAFNEVACQVMEKVHNGQIDLSQKHLPFLKNKPPQRRCCGMA